MTIEPTSEFIPHITMGDRLRRIRRDIKLSQRDFAHELGVKESTYNAWETGRNSVAEEVAIAKRIQMRWHVPAWWTLGLETPNGPHQDGPGGGDEVTDNGLKVRSSTKLSYRGNGDDTNVTPLFGDRELERAA